jgi:hypothetical protein
MTFPCFIYDFSMSWSHIFVNNINGSSVSSIMSVLISFVQHFSIFKINNYNKKNKQLLHSCDVDIQNCQHERKQLLAKWQFMQVTFPWTFHPECRTEEPLILFTKICDQLIFCFHSNNLNCKNNMYQRIFNH